MNKKKILEDIQSLIQDIGKCTASLVKAKAFDDDKGIRFQIAEMGRLMVAAHQELSLLYDQINTLYGLKEKADELYFRAFTLSADIHSTEAFKEAMDDYWHYVNYELNKEGGKDEQD